MSARKAMGKPEALATPIELAAFLGGDDKKFTTKTLANWRSAGKGPRFIKLEGGLVRYEWADVRAWLDEQRRAAVLKCAGT